MWEIAVLFCSFSIEVLLYLIDGALISYSPIKITSLYSKDKQFLLLLKYIKANESRLIGALVILYNIFHLISFLLMEELFNKYYIFKYGTVVFTIVTTIFYVYLEYIIKYCINLYSEVIVGVFAYPTILVAKLIFPLSDLIEYTVKYIFNLQSIQEIEPMIEIQNTIDYHSSKFEQIQRYTLITLSRLNIGKIIEIIIHRRYLIHLDLSLSMNQFIEKFLKIPSNQQFTPVFYQNSNDIIGYIDNNFLLKQLLNKEIKNSKIKNALSIIKEIIFKPYFMPKNMKILTFLKNLSSSIVKFFFVVDDNGELLGYINYDSILENLVIPKSHTLGANILPYNTGFIIKNETLIREINSFLNLKWEEKYVTILNLFLSLQKNGEDLVKIDNIIIEKSPQEPGVFFINGISNE